MIYRFVIVSDEADNFKLQIAIDSTATFMQLRNVILESAGYDKEQMDSFYICDDEWNKEKEVTCMDMGSDTDEDIWIMDDTQLDELLEDEDQVGGQQDLPLEGVPEHGGELGGGEAQDECRADDRDEHGEADDLYTTCHYMLQPKHQPHKENTSCTS